MAKSLFIISIFWNTRTAQSHIKPLEYTTIGAKTMFILKPQMLIVVPLMQTIKIVKHIVRTEL